MTVTDAVQRRRAIKWFDPSHRLSDAEFATLMEHALLSPTAFNIQNWRFVRVTDGAQRKAIRAVAWDQAQVEEASELLVLCFDQDSWKEEPERYWRNAPQEVSDLLVGWMGPFHEGREWLQRDEAQRSIGMAMQTLMLAAKAMGYDSCPMIGFDIEKVADVFVAEFADRFALAEGLLDDPTLAEAEALAPGHASP